MDLRQQRGLEIAKTLRIDRQEGRWLVPAQSRSGKYIVDAALDSPTCTCQDFETWGAKCKHIYAVEFLISGEASRDESRVVSEPPAVAERPTYKQDWPAYNAAQTAEKRLFQILLHDLCRGIEEPPQAKGRPRVPLSDAQGLRTLFFPCFLTVSKANSK